VTALAAGAADSTLASVLGFILIGGLVASGLTLTIIRVVRSTKSREKQMARLAAQLDGRSRVYLRMIENGLEKPDLLWVARSRGYGMIEHRFQKYYEFVYVPPQRPPGGPGPWQYQGRP
jgi:hypothetical protein